MSIKDLLNEADNYRYRTEYDESELISLVHDYNDFFAKKSERVDVPNSIQNYTTYEDGEEVIHEFYGLFEDGEQYYTLIERDNELEVTVN